MVNGILKELYEKQIVDEQHHQNLMDIKKGAKILQTCKAITEAISTGNWNLDKSDIEICSNPHQQNQFRSYCPTCCARQWVQTCLGCQSWKSIQVQISAISEKNCNWLNFHLNVVKSWASTSPSTRRCLATYVIRDPIMNVWREKTSNRRTTNNNYYAPQSN